MGGRKGPCQLLGTVTRIHFIDRREVGIERPPLFLGHVVVDVAVVTLIFAPEIRPDNRQSLGPANVAICFHQLGREEIYLVGLFQDQLGDSTVAVHLCVDDATIISSKNWGSQVARAPLGYRSLDSPLFVGVVIDDGQQIRGSGVMFGVSLGPQLALLGSVALRSRRNSCSSLPSVGSMESGHKLFSSFVARPEIVHLNPHSLI